MKKVFIVLGTRPEIIKLGPLANVLREADVITEIVHTGQHYDENMSGSFLEDFRLQVTHQLSLGNMPRGIQIGEMTKELSELFRVEEPDVVIVQGDTNTALSGGLAANACEIPLVHVEAGLRSFDRRMPEEHNRVMIDHIADLLCAPTSHAEGLLAAENVQGSVVVTGNTELDAIEMLVPSTSACVEIANSFGYDPYDFVVSTIHRPENTDDSERLATIIEALNGSSLPVLLAVHPRTRAAIKSAGLEKRIDSRVVQLCDPLPVSAMWSLLSICSLAISDSGGIQEDVTAFGTPLLVVRNSTERPEGIGTYAKLVSASGSLAEIVYTASVDANVWRQRLLDVPSPYRVPNTSPSVLISEAISEQFFGKVLQESPVLVETQV